MFTDTTHEKNTYCSGVYSEKHTKCSSISDASKTEYISLHHYMTPKTAFLLRIEKTIRYLVSNGLTKQIIMILIKIKHLLFASGNMLLLWVFYNFTFFMLVACSHREQVYSLETEIMISADWSRSGLNEKEQDYGATTVFYPTDGSSPLMVLMGDRTYKTVYLKEGRYDVVLFNRSFDDFGNLGFRGEDAYRTLEAHATNVVTKDVPSTEIIIMDSPDELAADCMESFEVTPGMSGNYSSGMTNWGGQKD